MTAPLIRTQAHAAELRITGRHYCCYCRSRKLAADMARSTGPRQVCKACRAKQQARAQ